LLDYLHFSSNKKESKKKDKLKKKLSEIIAYSINHSFLSNWRTSVVRRSDVHWADFISSELALEFSHAFSHGHG
jgi:hypothetical protein